MPSIKTRESLRTIKTFDRAKALGQKVKNGAGEVKEYGEELQNTRYGSANNMQAMRLRTPKGARQEMLPMVQVRSGIGD